MNTTPNYGLGLPLASERYDVTVFNNNNSIVDTQLKANADDTSGHKSNTNNPHQVTKSQVGLGNVPNVATNDQTPTFTEAVSRTNISSGDTIATLFGKIKKWLTDLKTVAFTGKYTDLTDLPTIPTKTSDLTNDSGFVDSNSLATVATSGSYADLSNKPTIPSKTSDLTNDSNFVDSSSLSTVATSGSYADLNNKPTIPSKTSDLTNDSGFIDGSGLATVATSGSYNDLTDKPSIGGGTVTSVATGTGLTGGPITSTGTISLATSGVTAGTKGPTADVTGSEGATIKVPKITVDTYGRITALDEYTLTNKNTTYSAMSLSELQTGTATTQRTLKATDLSSGITAKATHYGTCSTAAGTAAKDVTLADTNFKLFVGAIVGVKFSNTNTASSCTLNVNSTGAKSIYYNNAVYTGSSSSVCGYANRIIYFMYDGTYWVWMNMSTLDGNTTYSINEYTTSNPASLAAFVEATAKSKLLTTFKFSDSNNVLTLGTGWVKGYIQYQNGYGGQYSVGGDGLAYKSDGTMYRIFIDGTTSFTITKNKVENTTYSSKAAASGGTDVSLCTTGEKYTWNSKSAVTIGSTGTASASATRYQRVSVNGTYTTIDGTVYMEQTQTLSTSGTTTFTFSNSAITADSLIDPFVSIFGVSPSSITVSAGSCVIVFPAYSSAASLKCRIYIR